MHWAWWLFWVLTSLVLLWAFWRLHVDRQEGRKSAERMERAEAILRERFARGEVDEETFAQMMGALQSSPSLWKHLDPPLAES